MNAAQRQLVIQKLQEKLYILKGRTVGLLGLAFKPDTDDLRDAPSLEIAARLLQMGARVKVYDPIAMPACRRQYPELKIQYCDYRDGNCLQADAVVVVTEWNELGICIWRNWRAPWTSQSWWTAGTCFRRTRPADAGFDYTGVGRCAPSKSTLRSAQPMTTALHDPLLARPESATC